MLLLGAFSLFVLIWCVLFLNSCNDESASSFMTLFMFSFIPKLVNRKAQQNQFEITQENSHKSGEKKNNAKTSSQPAKDPDEVIGDEARSE